MFVPHVVHTRCWAFCFKVRSGRSVSSHLIERWKSWNIFSLVAMEHLCQVTAGCEWTHADCSASGLSHPLPHLLCVPLSVCVTDTCLTGISHMGHTFCRIMCWLFDLYISDIIHCLDWERGCGVALWLLFWLLGRGHTGYLLHAQARFSLKVQLVWPVW